MSTILPYLQIRLKHAPCSIDKSVTVVKMNGNLAVTIHFRDRDLSLRICAQGRESSNKSGLEHRTPASPCRILTLITFPGCFPWEINR